MTFWASVQHLSEKGYGTVRDPAGRLFFVRAVWPGEEGLFEEDGPGTARLVELQQRSPNRRDVPCPHWGLGSSDCFGCPWLFVDYQAQLERKEHRLRYALERLGLRDLPLQAIWPAPSPFAYRSRAQFKTDGQSFGYAALHGEGIAPVDDCLVLSEGMRAHLSVLRARLPNRDWRPEAPHLWNFIDLDEESDIANAPLNRRRPFQQVHRAQNERMRTWLRDKLQDCSGEYLELFCGSGNFTDLIAERGEAVLALEVGAEAVAALDARALPHVRAERADLYRGSALQRLKNHPARTLVANPPRAGLMGLTRLARQLPNLDAIAYVSCDVNTFAQDLRKLLDQGFSVVELQPLDQMPNTPHVEVLAFIRRV